MIERVEIWARAVVLATVTAGCADDPARAVVENRYPVLEDGGDPIDSISVYRAWYQTTLFPSPIAPGARSETEQTVPGRDYVYAVLAPKLPPNDPPTALIAVKSVEKLGVERDDTLTIAVSPETFAGDCASGSQLSQADADLITQRIFPGAFAGFSYDAATCVLIPLPDEAGASAAALADTSPGDSSGVDAPVDASDAPSD